MVHRPASYRVWGEGRARAPTFDPHTIKRMQVPLSPYSPISVLLRQPLSIKKELCRSDTIRKPGIAPKLRVFYMYIILYKQKIDFYLAVKVFLKLISHFAVLS
jgi:hypothetical protein